MAMQIFFRKPAFQSIYPVPTVLAAKGQKERQFYIDVSNGTINQQRLDPFAHWCECDG